MPVFLPVSHHVTAKDAARQLWREIYDLPNGSGLSVILHQPEEQEEEIWGVEWKSGPNDWADEYAGKSKTKTNEFSVFAKNGMFVVFNENISD